MYLMNSRNQTLTRKDNIILKADMREAGALKSKIENFINTINFTLHSYFIYI